jgi:hypothetical protein
MTWIASERDQFSLGQNQQGKISERRLARPATERFRSEYRCSDMFKAVRGVADELTVALGGVVPNVARATLLAQGFRLLLCSL